MTRLVSFDGTERCESTLRSPSTRDELREALSAPSPVSIRGSGLSYCQAGASEQATAVSNRRFDRIISFDETGHSITVESGVTVGQMLRHVVQKGFWFPVLPGHPEITIGGCAGFNTHGKTQHDIGQFSDHVLRLALFHPDHGEIECSPTENQELFELTLGGMGLTGWILDLTLRLQPLAGAAIRRAAHPAENYIDAVDIMESHDADGAHLYSWNDATRSGASFGRGVVYEETFVDHVGPARSKYRTLSAEGRGRFVPMSVWNRASTPVVNRAFVMLERRGRARVMPALDAAFPINGKEGYFHAFGRRGLREYQIIVPRPAWADTITSVEALISSTRSCITLSSLKLFRGAPRHLWFRGDGVCLTLDAPATERTAELFAGLDALAIDLGAPVNLAKDSRLDAGTAAKVFPGYQQFRDELHDFDPAHRFDSALRRRLDV